MTAALADLTSNLTEQARIGAEDVLAMRRIVWADASVSHDEADALMALNTACPVQAPEWIDYFVEVMTDYLVRQQQPEGYVDAVKAEWLMQWIDKDGRVDSRGELELLVKVLETATSVPQSLRTYALKQIETAVLTGSGPTRRERHDGDGTLDAGCITATEVALLQRVVYASAGTGGWIVSTEEADMLFRLKDATLGAPNAATWPDLFVKAVANHLMAHRNYETLSRDDQIRIDAYTADTDIHIGRFFRRMVGLEKAALPDTVLGIPDAVADEQAAAADHALTPAEITWTIDHIREDGRYDAMEKALVAILRNEGIVPRAKEI
ncbi:MAG: hypothetical protein JF571_04430 [Asticcacaulis sp.]|nr:hypothetical protein [Asticcacaulis sp.]